MSRYARASGLSLIEMMVAILIGSLLVLGLVQVFSASRSAYQLSEGLARSQENGRFAMDYLQRDIRMVGHFGCVNDQAHALASSNSMYTTFDPASVPLQFNVSIQGYEAQNTAPGASNITLATTPGTGGSFMPALPTQFSADTSNRVVNSDIIVLRYLAPEGASITGVATAGSSTTFTFDANRWDAMRGGISNPGLYGVTDCTSANLFQASAANAGTIVASSADLNQTYEAGQSMLYRAEVVVYYVGKAATGRPSLYRVRYSAAPGGGLVSLGQEELVEGIESMQLLYGQDRELDSTKSPSGYINSIGTASTVEASVTPVDNAWRRVGSVQIGLVVASPDRAGAPKKAADNPLMAAGVTFDPDDDGRYRTVYQSTVALRNRLYGQ